MVDFKEHFITFKSHFDGRLPEALFFIVFNPISTFQAVRSRTSGKWRYLIYPLYIALQGIVIDYDPFLSAVVGVFFAGALASITESLKLLSRPFARSRNDPADELIEFIRTEKPTMTELITVSQDKYTFTTLFDVLTSDSLIHTEDKRVYWKD